MQDFIEASFLAHVPKTTRQIAHLTYRHLFQHVRIPTLAAEPPSSLPARSLFP